MKPEYKQALHNTLLMVLTAIVLAVIMWAPTVEAQKGFKYCKHRATGEIRVIRGNGRCNAFEYEVYR